MDDHPLRRKTDSIPETPEKVAAQVVKDAAVVAQAVVNKATETAAELATIKEEKDERMTHVLADALREVFGENEKSQRFIDVSRIPLICQSIISIHSDIKDIKEIIKDSDARHVNQDQFTPVKLIVYGFAGLVLTAVVVALIALVLR